ncbi:hypothetical protein BJV82DRAFT_618386 [Fennellomyces sp. T-0311]|nr:hypothetical protein BJV82DRAFT_618386 [Fennellomyces sp. T-0311]
MACAPFSYVIFGWLLTIAALDDTIAITSVALGVRVAHLIDVAHLTSDQANQLLALLRQEPTCKHLVILEFKDRYTFLCHRQELKKHVDAMLNAPDQWVYIDIRGKKGPPAQRACPEILLFWIRHRLQPFVAQNTDDVLWHSPVVPSYMVALTGWLLEYPVLYMTHHESDGIDHELDEWESVPNCLGDRRLSLVRVWLLGDSFWQDYMLLSYSYPEMDLPTDPMRDLERKFYTRMQPHQTFLPARVQVTHEYVTLDRVAL